MEHRRTVRPGTAFCSLCPGHVVELSVAHLPVYKRGVMAVTPHRILQHSVWL